MPRSPLTRIVATIGPATTSADMIEALIAAGVSVFRLNFSHGSQEEHRTSFSRIRHRAEQAGHAIAILQDLQGPKLRIGEVSDAAPVEIAEGDLFRICTAPVIGTREMVSTSYDQLAHDLQPDMPILIDDGRIELEVVGIELNTPHGDVVTSRVIRGGTITSHKGINLPHTHVSAPPITDKDRDDLAFGVALGVDLIALSFVRSASDLALARDLITDAGGSQPLIAKIEKPQAVDVLPSIIDAADGVMVARGDLGVELSPEDVPLIQKRIIRLCNELGKPVITATQMLESMIASPQPTRAEASDVANAILDGTDAVMLSGETAIGDYPVEAVAMMATIARAIERAPASRGTPSQSFSRIESASGLPTEPQAIGHAARALADDLRVKAIVVFTATGSTAQRVSQERPRAPIVAFTGSEQVGRRLAMWHGIIPLVLPLASTIDGLVAQADRELIGRGLASQGDRVIIVGANPRRGESPSVFLEIHSVGQ